MNVCEALAQRLEVETRYRLEQARPLFHQAARAMPDVQVRCDLRGAAAGQFRQQRDGALVIRYNVAMAEAQADDFLAETVPHEVAHLVAHVCHGRVKPHGPEWRQVMRWFGIDEPRRCHDFASPSNGRTQRRWRYQCDCREHQLSTTRHNRARGGLAYLCRLCGSPLRHVAE